MRYLTENIMKLHFATLDLSFMVSKFQSGHNKGSNKYMKQWISLVKQCEKITLCSLTATCTPEDLGRIESPT